MLYVLLYQYQGEQTDHCTLTHKNQKGFCKQPQVFLVYTKVDKAPSSLDSDIIRYYGVLIQEKGQKCNYYHLEYRRCHRE